MYTKNWLLEADPMNKYEFSSLCYLLYQITEHAADIVHSINKKTKTIFMHTYINLTCFDTFYFE